MGLFDWIPTPKLSDLALLAALPLHALKPVLALGSAVKTVGGYIPGVKEVTNKIPIGDLTQFVFSPI